MKTADFDFDLPNDRIATHPARPRDAARMLVVPSGPAAGLQDRIVRDLPDFLRPGDVLVFNDTKVIPARLYGKRGAARIEAMLHKRTGEDGWWAFARPAKRLRPGDVVTFAPDLSATVEERNGGEVLLRFPLAGAELFAALHRYGELPLPPYISRPEGQEATDAQDYQTVFAAREGAVAAPTAGLHFTPELMEALRARGVETVAITLHVGAGTFLPVKVEDVREHQMHAEYGEISAEAAARIQAARAKGGRVVAVGTTSLRLLESVADDQGRLREFAGETDIFIFPGYRFKAVDVLMTNFHLPCSTLFMLVCAFAGTERMKAAYAHAVEAGYRFYSYGDASLLARET